MNRALIVDGSGVIRRQLRIRPADVAANVKPGESAFLILDDDGRAINDEHLVISEAGEWALRDGAPQGPLPNLAIAYIPTA